METAIDLCSCGALVSRPCMVHAKRIEDWQLVFSDKEHVKTSLEWSEPGLEKPTQVRSAVIIQSSGIFALTQDGKWYMLGQPRESWIKWLIKKNYQYDPADPLKVKGTQ